MDKINAAVIGVGSMGKNHVRIYSEIEDVKLVAVSDINEEVKKIAEKFNCRYYKDYNEMLDKENIDLVNIVVPTRLHCRIALDVIKHGKHVFVEKPIADTIENAEKIIKAADEKQVKLAVGHIERFNPAVRKLKELLEKNTIGKIWNLTIFRKGPFPSRVRDVGVVIDLAVHDLDIMRYLLNSEISRVYAETEKRIHTEHEDFMNALMRFENGVVGILDTNWLTPVKIREININGEKGMIKANYITQKIEIFENGFNHFNSSYPNINKMTEGNVKQIEVEKKEPLKMELESFVNAIRNNTEPLVTGRDGLMALSLAHDILKSADRK